MKNKSIMRCIPLALSMILLISLILINPVKIYADVGGGISPRFDPILIVGQVDDLAHTGIGAITESDAQTGCDIRITKVSLIPSCGALGPGVCTAPDPGVITIHDANGVLIAAEGIAFNAQCSGAGVPFGCCTGAGTGNCNGCVGSQWKAQLTNAALGLYEFTPTANVILVAPNDTTPPPGCVLSFGIDVIKLPTIDSIPATPAVKDTSRIAFWEGLSLNCPNSGVNSFPASGTGTGASTVAAPDYTVDKTGPALSKVGHTVRYNYSITNKPDSLDLNLVSVIDDVAGDLTAIASAPAAGCAVLSVGETCTFFKDYVVQPGDDDPLINEVTVIYNVPLTDTNITHTDTHSVNLFKPRINIIKECECIPSDTTIGCQVGDPINYKITVQNTSSSDSPNLNCTITDTLLPNPPFPKTVNNFPPGGQNVTNKTIPFPNISEDCLTNTAKVDCTVASPWLNPVNDSAACEVCKEKPPSSGGEEPYKAAVWNDSSIPGFYISPKVYQFMHPNTDYYAQCTDILFKGDPRITVPPCVPFGTAFQCPSACRERFKSKTAASQPEVCCTSKTVDDTFDQNFVHCPDTGNNPHPPVKTAMTSKGNAGWYEWTIALPKKPVTELNIEIECGVLKPNSWALLDYESIELCAAVTGEQIGPNCTRIPGTYLLTSALPRLEVIAHPGCNNDFTPFHLTSYRNPSTYAITGATDPQCPSGSCLNDSTSLKVLDGTVGSRIALKACMEKTILVKWPKEGEVNELGEEEAALEAGDLIKVRMAVPNANTVDVYCSQYSVTIGGIGIPETLLGDYNCDCISDANCQF